MARGGRPRKLGERRPSGRLKYDRKDKRFETSLVRCREFGVTAKQSINPLAGYLAGVLYLRGVITAEELGRYFSFLQIVPVEGRAIQYGIRVSGGGGGDGLKISKRYYRLARRLGRDIDVLHHLTQDRLTVSVARLRRVLQRVPLSALGSSMMTLCEAYLRGRDPVIVHEKLANREPLTPAPVIA